MAHISTFFTMFGIRIHSPIFTNSSPPSYLSVNEPFTLISITKESSSP